MASVRPNVFIFNWPGFIGGADTKLAHLLVLLHKDIEITVVPNRRALLNAKCWTRFMDRLGVRYMMFGQLPRHLEGFGLSLSNDAFFSDRIAHRAKEKGLKIIWSSEMMWHHEGELEAVKDGTIDQVLYTSEFQKEELSPGYGGLPWAITGNYIDPDSFPFKERRNRRFTIGRLSRAAPEKYPEDFPVFYECLKLPDVRFRVMGWSTELARKYRWHRFDRRWDLLEEEEESQKDFLYSLDLFVYPLGHDFRESWGRSTVEAMLSGCVPLVPAGHQFEQLMVHGQSGFICDDFLEYKQYCQELCLNYSLRRQMAAQCRHHAATRVCDREQHLQRWLAVFR